MRGRSDIEAVLKGLQAELGTRYGTIPPEDGRLLQMLVQLTGARSVLEIGSGVGLSTLWLCRGLLETGGRVTTLENDPALVRLAREHAARAGVEGMIGFIECDALRRLPTMKETFDMVFIDGMKTQYADYLRAVLPLVRLGGLIAAHDVAPLSDEMRSFIDLLKEQPLLDTEYLQLPLAAGVSVSFKRAAADRQAAPHFEELDLPADCEARRPAALVAHKVLRRYEEYGAVGCHLLVDPATSRAQLLDLAAHFLREYGEGFPGAHHIGIYVYSREEAFAQRNSFTYPPEDYFQGCLAQIYYRKDWPEGRTRRWLVREDLG